MSGFQTVVNANYAPALAGDFATVNPRATVIAGPGGLVAGPSGLTCGRFAWLDGAHDPDGTLTYANNYGLGAPAGFVPRTQLALITTFLAENSNLIPAGSAVELFTTGDFWAQNDGSTVILPGDSVYVNFADGKVSNAAGTSASTGSIAAGTGAGTGSIAAGSDILVLTASSSAIYPGGTISGTGVISGTTILEQISGAVGGIGSYRVSKVHNTAVASTAISETHGVYTAASAVSGTIGIGDSLSGTSVVAGTSITALGTGTGGVGTYIVNNNTVVASTTITGAKNIVSTKWKFQSQASAGELVKMGTHSIF